MSSTREKKRAFFVPFILAKEIFLTFCFISVYSVLNIEYC